MFYIIESGDSSGKKDDIHQLMLFLYTDGLAEIRSSILTIIIFISLLANLFNHSYNFMTMGDIAILVYMQKSYSCNTVSHSFKCNHKATVTPLLLDALEFNKCRWTFLLFAANARSHQFPML